MNRSFLVAVILLCALCNAALAEESLSSLQWMCGTWGDPAKAVEFWMAPKDGLMLGLNQTARPGKKPFFEYLRIEERPTGIVFVASPLGREPTEFKLRRLSEHQAVFENPDHDFPQRIAYRLDGEALVAEISAGEGEERQGQAMRWPRWADCEGGRARVAGPCERKWTFPVPFYQSITWSPDGSKLALSAVTTSWDEGYRLFVVGADGSSLTRIDSGGESELYPVWSPDGSRIAFASTREGNSDVYVMASDGTEMARLTRHEASDSYPSWSPDGGKIAFHSQRDGNYEIYVMNADGSSQTRLTDHPADDYNPSWSPDGTWIAFDADRDDLEGDEIYVIAPDGSGLSQVVSRGVFPTWSPDSQKILYTLEGLYVVGVDGVGASRLLENAVYAAWSPDGSTIAAAAIDFDENCRDHHSVIVLEADGSGGKQLLP